jgi:hypothetical protein
MKILIGVLTILLLVGLFYGIVRIISYITKITDIRYLGFMTMFGGGILVLVICFLYMIGDLVIKFFG